MNRNETIRGGLSDNRGKDIRNAYTGIKRINLQSVPKIL